VYYISEYIGSKQDHKVDDQCYEQYSEIKDIQWLTKKECLQKIREKNQTKCKIIENIFEFIENYKNDFILINK
jgi:NADH pyrophosphatase NudC (nudix superfamily)